MTDFLLEIFSEEIPAKIQKNAADNFANATYEIFTKAGLLIKSEQIKSLVSPRRIAIYISNLNDEQATISVKKIGPKTSADKKAIEGFLRANGLTNASELQTTEHNGSTCYLFEKPSSSIKTTEILRANLPAILQKMAGSWPKLMRFDVAESLEQPKWIRPIRNILCIFGEEIIDIKFAGFKSNNFTYGHFLNSSKPLQIKLPQDYKNILRDNFVIVDQNERKEKIIAQIKEITDKNDLETIDDAAKSALSDEVNGLCEWPTALLGEIDKKFMSLPQEVLILTLKLNQRFFCLRDKKNHLSTKFIFISNAIVEEERSKKIISDNEKIVRARLSDAQFFIDEDLKIPLIARMPDLKNIIFHQKIGSVYDRLTRIEELAELLALWIAHCDISLVERAANLCKNDLVTKAVAELPELQGKIGSFYAKAQGENHKVATAIYEHYLPLGPTAELPKTPLGSALAIADKFDAIIGLFLANEKPTSSKDPFALRRAALGIIRISFTHNINLSLRVLIDKAFKLYKPKLLEKLLQEQNISKEDLSAEIIKFFLERLKNFLHEHQSIRKDILNAVIDDYVNNLETHQYYDILVVAKKTVFLNELVQKVENESLIKIYKRSANVLSIEEKKDKKKYDGKPSILGLKTKHEKILKQLIKKITPNFRKLIASGDFNGAFKLLHLLEHPLTHFFDHVTVNDKNKKTRENRLLLLSEIRSLFNEVADLSKIEM